MTSTIASRVRRCQDSPASTWTRNQNPVVLLKDPTQRAAAEAYFTEFRTKRGLPDGAILIRAAEYSFDELREWRDILLQNQAGMETMVSLDIDEVANKLRIGVKAAAVESMRQLTGQLTIPSNAAIVEYQRSPSLFRTVREYHRPVEGGLQMMDENHHDPCTLGFNARQDGKRLFVSASHCSGVKNELDDYRIGQPNYPGYYIGDEYNDRDLYACWWFLHCRWSDASLFEYTAGTDDDFGKIAKTFPDSIGVGEPGGLTIYPAQPTLKINDKQSGGVAGEWVYKVGRTTGWTGGPILQTCVLWEFEEDRLVCQYIAEVYAANYDSGSPIFTWDGKNGAALRGVLWGSATGQSPSNSIYFSTIDGIEHDLGEIDVCQRSPFDPPGDCIVGW